MATAPAVQVKPFWIKEEELTILEIEGVDLFSNNFFLWIEDRVIPRNKKDDMLAPYCSVNIRNNVLIFNKREREIFAKYSCFVLAPSFLIFTNVSIEDRGELVNAFQKALNEFEQPDKSIKVRIISCPGNYEPFRQAILNNIGLTRFPSLETKEERLVKIARLGALFLKADQEIIYQVVYSLAEKSIIHQISAHSSHSFCCGD